MKSIGIRDLISSFSPASDFFAVASADGRIKIWDTLKGQVQGEFFDFRSTSEDTELLSESKRRHLLLEYKCMKWVPLESKKKKKNGRTLLVLGTGSGDVLAVEVSTGNLRWRVCDCHSGGVSAVSFSQHNSFLYTAGLDGMICQIDCSAGSVIMKFRAFTKGISALAISADGNKLAVAAGQLRIFSCSNNKKIQKFYGHPVSVRCMIFSEDGKFILTSGVGEKHIALWKIDGGKTKSACCVLSTDHPVISLDCRVSDKEGSKIQALYVLALLETGVCYFWYGNGIEELQNTRPTKILPAIDETSLPKKSKNQAVLAAKIDGIARSACGLVHVAHGCLIKPSFEKLAVEYGVDMSLNASMEGFLFPISQSYISNKGRAIHTEVTTLDRANAEDAVLPIPKLHINDKKRKHGSPLASTFDFENAKLGLDASMKKSSFWPNEVEMQRMDVDEPVCIEDRLRAAGLLDDSTISDNHDSTFDVSSPRRKMKRLKSAAAIHPLLRLSGRLQLIMTQIDKAGESLSELLSAERIDDNAEEEEDDDEDDEVNDVVIYGEDDEIESEEV